MTVCNQLNVVGGDGDGRGWDGWLASLTQWTWIWLDSSSWWWTGRSGVLWLGSQRIRHDWVTEMNWTELNVVYELASRCISGKESACQWRTCRRCSLHPWVGKVPWRRKWQPTPVFLLGNPMDRWAWRATVHGVAKSWTQWATEHAQMWYIVSYNTEEYYKI